MGHSTESGRSIRLNFTALTISVNKGRDEPGVDGGDSCF